MYGSSREWVRRVARCPKLVSGRILPGLKGAGKAGAGLRVKAFSLYLPGGPAPHWWAGPGALVYHRRSNEPDGEVPPGPCDYVADRRHPGRARDPAALR